MSKSNLANVWASITFLLENGLSVIPVRDKQEGERPPKTPYYLWKRFQTEKYTKDALWHDMESKGTSAVAIVCGAISGNLEVIDIDTKFKSDAAVKLFDYLEKFDPLLYGKLRIHKTPSGGFHILYRVVSSFTIPGNQKLAGRFPYDGEITKQKIINFIETRGSGGYILAPPSLDYAVYRDIPIPLISEQDRNNIIAICRTLDEAPTQVSPAFKSTPKSENFYDDNPWNDFNKRVDPVDLLIRNGWITEGTRNAKNIYFTRPGKNSGISMSFREDIRKYYCFTSSTEFDLNKAYNPVDVLLILELNNDKKAAYCWLVNNGYGKVKTKVEQSLAQSYARQNKPLPHNFSPEAKELHQQTIQQLKEDHPFGQFIKYDVEEEKQSVSREALLFVANNLGFRYYQEEAFRIIGNLIYSITPRQFQDVLKEYIHEEDAKEYETLCNIFEAFMQKNGNYTMSRLQLLDPSLIMKDTKDVCYKFYQNGYLTISAEAIEFSEYEDNDLLIWSHSLQHRNYIPDDPFRPQGDFVDFIRKATLNEDNVKLILGYLAHEYKDETTGFIIVLTETCPDPKQGGGSGKNVFCNLLKLTTSYTSKPGAQAKFDEKFFQSWNRQRIFAISDAPKHFDFLFLKEPSTGEFIWKKLFKDEISIPCDEAPKFIVQTNYSYEISDGGLKRRIKNIEFTDYFTKAGGLDVYYKKHFPNEWNEQDFAGYDNYIAECVQLYIKSGRKLSETIMTDTGKLKQWEQTFGSHCCTFILEFIEQWINLKEVSNFVFKSNFDSYVLENNILRNFQPSMNKIHTALISYCENNDINYKKDLVKNDGLGNTYKYRLFEVKQNEI